MLSNKWISRWNDRLLHRALASVVITQFPNPERRGCPEQDVLHAMAAKRLPLMHVAFDHVGSCSPCFREVRDMRRALRYKKIATLIAASAMTVVTFWWILKR